MRTLFKKGKNIKIIPAQLLDDNLQIITNKKKRVAAYARVSTDMEEQEKSYKAQVDYYKKFIMQNNDWEFVNVYADEGISGLNTKKRIGFKKMIEDANSGKIDLILTKSISRFARNTVDSIQTIRELKARDIEVIFEKENIKTLDPTCEMVLTIMSSLAQEESRSISQNCTWGQRKRFSDGRYSVAYSRFLGYDNHFKVNESEAATVRLIFDLFLKGKTFTEIKNELKRQNIRTVTGKTTWENSVIKSILSNEKYCGDALLQKSYTKDYITKKHVKNNGNVAQYYVNGGHEAIISKEEFELAKIELKLRDENRIGKRDIFSGKLICSECGGKYYKVTERSRYNDKIWIVYKCDNRKEGCTSKSIKIEMVKELFLDELKRKIKINYNKFDSIIGTVVDYVNIDGLLSEKEDIINKIDILSNKERNELTIRCIEKLKQELVILDKKIAVRKNTIALANRLKKNTRSLEFDDNLFLSLVKKVYIDKDKNIKIDWNI